MKTDKKILMAFVLNLMFSLFELFGGIFTSSVAIISDSVHDLGDAVSIGLSFLLERKSKKAPDGKYTYGYRRFSVLGSFITTVILVIGSVGVIAASVNRLFNPVEINYNGMIIFAVIGTAVNLAAAIFTSGGDSLNRKAVNLHMLEDVLGWIVVLIGAVIMKFTTFSFIDPLLSVGVSLFILVNAFKNLKEIADIFLEKAPDGIDADKIGEILTASDAVKGVHHVHIRSLDGYKIYATMHVVVSEYSPSLKAEIKHLLRSSGIDHMTVELEEESETCEEKHCNPSYEECSCGHHHHHH